MTIELFLKFPDRTTMLQVASALSGIEGVEHPTVDGWLVIDPETGASHYWNLCEVGTLFEPTGEMIETAMGPQPVMAPLEGYHVNGLWHGDADTLPPALSAFRIFPAAPKVRFG